MNSTFDVTSPESRSASRDWWHSAICLRQFIVQSKNQRRVDHFVNTGDQLPPMVSSDRTKFDRVGKDDKIVIWQISIHSVTNYCINTLVPAWPGCDFKMQISILFLLFVSSLMIMPSDKSTLRQAMVWCHQRQQVIARANVDPNFDRHLESLVS